MLRRLLYVLSFAVISSCATSPPAPAALIHFNQITLASSATQKGDSLLQHAKNLVEKILAENHALTSLLEAKNYPEARRKVFNMAKLVGSGKAYNPAQDLVLRDSIQRIINHLVDASLAPDTSNALKTQIPAVRRNAETLRKTIFSLTTYIKFALKEDTPESLQLISEEIDRVAAQLNGQLASDTSYTLNDLQLQVNSLKQRLKEEQTETSTQSAKLQDTDQPAASKLPDLRTQPTMQLIKER